MRFSTRVAAGAIVVVAGAGLLTGAWLAPAGTAADGDETSSAVRIVDRTLVCATGTSAGGVRLLEIGARSGIRQFGGTGWRSPAHIWAYNRRGIRYGVVGVAAPVSQHGWRPTEPVNGTSPPWPTLPDPGTSLLLTTLWSDAKRCKPTASRVPLSAAGLRGGRAGVFADEYECAVPKRVVVRFRAAFLIATRFTLNRRFGFHLTNDVVREGSFAPRTPSGTPLAYAEVFANGTSRVFAAARRCSAT